MDVADLDHFLLDQDVRRSVDGCFDCGFIVVGSEDEADECIVNVV